MRRPRRTRYSSWSSCETMGSLPPPSPSKLRPRSRDTGFPSSFDGRKWSSYAYQKPLLTTSRAQHNPPPPRRRPVPQRLHLLRRHHHRPRPLPTAPLLPGKTQAHRQPRHYHTGNGTDAQRRLPCPSTGTGRAAIGGGQQVQPVDASTRREFRVVVAGVGRAAVGSGYEPYE